MNIFRSAIFLGLQLTFVISAYAQTSPAVKISGEVTKPLTLSVDDLAKMKRSTAVLTDRDGKPHSYQGVALQELLEQAGVTMGKQLRGEQLTKYLMVKCADGYEVLFSLAELDSSFTDRVVILADKLENNSLPDGKGPFRLVVPGEKKPARSSFQVVEMVIRYAKD